MITPPVGMNLFVVHGIRSDDGRIKGAIVGGLPYAVIMLPELASWLPEQTRGY